MTPSAIVTDEIGSIDLIPWLNKYIHTPYLVTLQACFSYCRLQLLFSLKPCWQLWLNYLLLYLSSILDLKKKNQGGWGILVQFVMLHSITDVNIM